MKLSFRGCDQYDWDDDYHFTDRFEQWWEKELAKRIPDSKEFARNHGKGWGLSVVFRAPKGTRKPSLLGPFNDRYSKRTEWYPILPSFRYKSPDAKAYVPLLRQFLQQLAVVLEREQIDPSELREDSNSLLKRFASQRGMLEYDSLKDYMAAEAKKEREKTFDSSRLLKADGVIGERLKALRRKYNLKFGVAFDATAKPRRGKGWLTNYAVVDFTVALPSKRGEIPDDLYAAAIEIFSHTEKLLQRTRTSFMLRIVPALKKQAWSLALLLRDRDLAGTHALLRKTAAELLPVMLANAPFKKQYANAMQALLLYSRRDNCVYAFPSEVAITLRDHYRDCDAVEQSVLSGKCGENIICWSGVYLGNMYYFLQQPREAIPHWQRAADTGEPEALMCIGGAYATLGNMEKAFQFCKKALQKGVSRKLLDDRDFAEFRRHPLFTKLKDTQKKKPAPPAKPLSPKWTMPKNLEELVEQNDGMWDDERWKPILLTVMSDTASRGRKRSLSWQLEFDPYRKLFKAAGKQIKETGVEPDGDAWASFIKREFAKRYPDLAKELESDSETSTCVLSVKSERTCERLLELVWSIIKCV